MGTCRCTKQQVVIDKLLLAPVKGTMKLDRRLDRRDRLQPLQPVETSSTCLVCENRGPETAGTGVSREYFVAYTPFTQGVRLDTDGRYIGFVLSTNKCI